MAKITPPVQDSYIIRPGVEAKFDQLQQVVSELGIFGVIIGYASIPFKPLKYQ